MSAKPREAINQSEMLAEKKKKRVEGGINGVGCARHDISLCNPFRSQEEECIIRRGGIVGE